MGSINLTWRLVSSGILQVVGVPTRLDLVKIPPWHSLFGLKIFPSRARGKKFKFLLDLLDPKNQQKSIQYLQSGKKTLNYSSLDPPYFDQFVPSLKMLIFGEKFW